MGRSESEEWVPWDAVGGLLTSVAGVYLGLKTGRWGIVGLFGLLVLVSLASIRYAKRRDSA
jgi:apolipoprotein N-acyltransferase